MYTVLVVEDELEIQNYLALALRRHGCELHFSKDVATVANNLERYPETSLLLVDLSEVHRNNNVRDWGWIRQRWPDLPVLTFGSYTVSENYSSVLPNPIGDEKLLDAILARLGRAAATVNRNAVQVIKQIEPSHAGATESWSQHVEILVKQMRACDVSVLVRGETGVGKEVLARKLHAASKRASGPFLKLNCAALPSELVESELFGYERGAFTGAFKNTPGKFELANGGAILLDEIGDMDFRLQAKLLQVLQDKEFHRLGAKDLARVDVRVMAATHCDLEQAIFEKRFREDLYYRLNIIEVHIPPLRERPSEILVLAQELLQKYSAAEQVTIPEDLQCALLEHHWPGNIRELENVMRKFLVFGNADLVIRELRKKAERNIGERRNPRRFTLMEKTLGVPSNAREAAMQPEASDVPLHPIAAALEEAALKHPMKPVPVAQESAISRKTHGAINAAEPEPTISILAEVDEARKKAEVEAIIMALNAALWNRKEAARLLEIDYKALLYKMKKLGIGTKNGNGGESRSAFSALAGIA